MVHSAKEWGWKIRVFFCSFVAHVPYSFFIPVEGALLLFVRLWADAQAKGNHFSAYTVHIQEGKVFFFSLFRGVAGAGNFFFFACAEEQDISQPVHPPPRHRTLNREFLRHQLQVGEGVLQRVVGWGSLQWCVRVCTCGGGHFAVIFALLGSFWGQFLSAKQ